MADTIDVAGTGSETFQDMRAQTGGSALAVAPAFESAFSAPKAGAPEQPSYKPLFNYSAAGQLDADPTGALTRMIGSARGDNYGTDTVLELNVYGQAVSADELRKLDGGEALLSIAARKRQGQRGFLEAVGTGSGTDFVPYIGDLATLGVSIRNMKVVRDGFRKMQKEGAQALTLQEKVLMKTYEEDMTRQSQQTWLGTVGTIVRQAPAFAGEFLTSGGLFKAGSKAIGMAGKEVAEDVIQREIRKVAMGQVYEASKKPLFNRAALKFSDMGFDDVAKGIVKSNGLDIESAAGKKALSAAMEAAETYVEGFKNPSKLRAAGDFLTEYGKRGMFDHLDEVVRDLPPSVMGKLREAAGVAFVEAPIKGGLYAAFDFLAVNPVAAAVAGADEAVTETELGINLSGDEELIKNAKMLAFGSAWAEYASEVSGRAFNALGGIVLDNVAGDVGRNIARKGLRATQEFKDEGSFVRRTFDATYGTEAQIKARMGALGDEALEDAFKAGKLGGKTVAEARATRGLTEQLVKERLELQDKSFIGYWMASKMVDKGMTPQGVTKLLETMGYDDILGEFMEERYNGFAQGLFGLDGTAEENKGVFGRLAHAAKAAIPSFKQGSAEILAFALPMVGRAMVNKGYETLGAGLMGRATEFATIRDQLISNTGVHWRPDGEAPQILSVKPSDENSGSVIADFVKKAGRVDLSADRASALQGVPRMVDALYDAASASNMLREDRVGVGTKVARSLLGVVSAAISGNPLMAFHDPMKAMLVEKGGREGVGMLLAAQELRRREYRIELARRTGKSADDAASAVDATEETRAEARFNDPEIEAAIAPIVKAGLELLVRRDLMSKGVLEANEEDVTRFLNRLDPENTGMIAGVPRQEFRKKLGADIFEAASGRMTVDIIGKNAQMYYRRPEAKTLSEVSKATEAFLNSMGVVSLIHGPTEASPRAAFRAVMGLPMEVSLWEQAAGESGTEAEQESARFRLIKEMMVGVRFGDSMGWKKATNTVTDYARVLLTAQRRFLTPQFDYAGKRYGVTGAAGAYTVASTDGEALAGISTFPTMADALAAAQAFRGADGTGLERRPSNIYFTPSQSFFTSNASMMLSEEFGMVRNYLLQKGEGKNHADNPFMTMPHAEAKAKVESDLRLSALWLNRGTVPLAKGTETAAEAAHLAAFGADGKSGYEARARVSAEAAGIGRYQDPGSRGEKGWLFTPAVTSENGDLYVPYRYVGASAAIIEDAVERALERADNIVVRDGKRYITGGVFRDPRNLNAYGPAAKAFMNTVLQELNRIVTADDAIIGKRLTDAGGEANAIAIKALRDEASYLADYMFDPRTYNLEAVSHAVAGFVFYQADAAIRGGTGSAYYGTLGLIAKAVRADAAVYGPFASLANRLAGGGMLDASGGALAAMIPGFVPRRFLDDTTAPRAVGEGEIGRTPVADAGALGVQVEASIKLARSGVTRSETSAMTEAARVAEAKRFKEKLDVEMAKGIFNEEDAPALLEELAKFTDLFDRAIGANLVEQFGEEGARALAYRAPKPDASEASPDAPTASMSEETMGKYPAFAIALGQQWLALKPANPGDRRNALDRIFDEWKSRDPMLPESARAKFVESVKAAGLYREGREFRSDSESVRREVEKGAMDLSDLLGSEDSDSSTPADVEGEESAYASFDADAMANLLAKEPTSNLFMNALYLELPGASHNKVEALRIMYTETAKMYTKGVADTESLASLFDGGVWASDGSLHPALADAEAFDAWISADRPETKTAWGATATAALKALGLEGAFDAANMLKGAYAKSIQTINVKTDGNGQYLDVELKQASHSASPATREALIRGLRRGKADTAAAIKLLEAEANLGIAGRSGRLADAAELLFGEGNELSHQLRDARVRAIVIQKIGAEIATMAKQEKPKPGSYLQLFNSFTIGTRETGGLFTERLVWAARKFAKGGADAAEAAVDEVLRGDSMFLGEAGDRGGVWRFLNDAAAIVPAASTGRRGKNARGKVKGLFPEKSAGQEWLLLAPQFEAAFTAAGGEPAALALGRRFGEWASGAKVFAKAGSLNRAVGNFGDEFAAFDSGTWVPEPVSTEIDAALRIEFDRGRSEYVHAMIYTGDKGEGDTLVTWPRAQLEALTAEAGYDAFSKAVRDLMRAGQVSAKRTLYVLAQGPSLSLQNATVGILVSEKPEHRELFHGNGYIFGKLTEYAQRMGFGRSAKYSATEVPGRGGPVVLKGKQVMVTGDEADGSAPQGELDLMKAGTEAGVEYLTDFDSVKEHDGLAKNTTGSVIDHFIAGRMDEVVRLSDGRSMKVSEVATEYGFALVPVTVNGAKAQILTIKQGLRLQYAAAPFKAAGEKLSTYPVDVARGSSAVAAQAALNQAEIGLALGRRNEGQYAARAREARADGGTDAALRLLEAGVDSRDPDIVKLLGPREASARKDAFEVSVVGGKAVNENFVGARVVESEPGVPSTPGDGRWVEVADPYKGMGEINTGLGHDPATLVHDSIVLAPEEIEAFGGAKRRFASTAMNLGTAVSRYGLRVDAAALGLKDEDQEGIAAEIGARLIGLKAEELASLSLGEPSRYLEAYKAQLTVKGKSIFTKPDGTALEPAQILSFSDLVEVRGGKLVFDRTRLYHGKDAKVAADGSRYVFLNGELDFSSRTPRSSEASELVAAIAEPADLVPADGTQAYLEGYAKPDGTMGARKAFYAKGTMVPGGESVIRMTPVAKFMAGSDEDADQSSFARLPKDRFGREMPRVKDAVAAIANPDTTAETARIKAAAQAALARATTPEQKTEILQKEAADLAAVGDRVAEQIADAAIKGEASAIFWGNVSRHRNLDVESDRKRWGGEGRGHFLGDIAAISAWPFSQQRKTEVKAGAKKVDLTGPDAAAKAEADAESSAARSLGVSVFGSLNSGRRAGMTFAKPLNQGKPVLRKPEGAKSAYWGNGFVVEDRGWSRQREVEFISFATGSTNAAFDNLKEALLDLAKMSAPHLELFLFLGHESGIRSQSEFDNFHRAWTEWANGKDGEAMATAYRHEKFPNRYGGAAFEANLESGERMVDTMAMAEEEAEGPYVYRLIRGLARPHKRAVLAIMAANGFGETGLNAAFPIAQAFERLEILRAVGAVTDWKKTNTSDPEAIERGERVLDTVWKRLSTTVKYGIRFGNAEGSAILHSSLQTMRSLLGEAKKSFDGAPVFSALYPALIEQTPEGFANGERPSKKDAAASSIARLLPWAATMRLTPAATGAKISAILADETAKTVSFLEATEDALHQIYKAWAKSMRTTSGKPNAALAAMLTPGKSGAKRITLTGSLDIGAEAANIAEGLKALRDWKPGGLGSAKIKGVEITPADLYWMLMQYSALTADKTLEAGRATASLLPLFGAEVYRSVSDYQILRLQDDSGAEGLMRFAKHTSGYVPDAYSRGANLPWGSYDKWLADNRKAPAEETAEAPEAKPEVAKAVEAKKVDVGYGQSFEIVQLAFGAPLPEGVIDGHRFQGKTVLNAKPGERGALGNPFIADDVKGGQFTRAEAVAKFREAFLNRVNTDAAYRGWALTLRGKKVGYYKPGEKDIHLQAVQEWLAQQPASALIEGQKPLVTSASSAMQALNSHADNVAAARREDRLLPTIAFNRGMERTMRPWTAEAKAAHAARATAMASALRATASLPWLSQVSTAAPVLNAASNIITAMGYPEPAVCEGAFRAIGRAAVELKATDAVAAVSGILTRAGAAKTADEKLLAHLRGQGRAVLAMDPAVSVMAFAIASEPLMRTTPAALENTAKLVLSDLGIGPSASMAQEETPVSTPEFSTQTPVEAMMTGDDKRAAALMAESAVGFTASRASDTPERQDDNASAKLLADAVRAADARLPRAPKDYSDWERDLQRKGKMRAGSRDASHVPVQIAVLMARDPKAGALVADFLGTRAQELRALPSLGQAGARAAEALDQFLVNGELREVTKSAMTPPEFGKFMKSIGNRQSGAASALRTARAAAEALTGEARDLAIANVEKAEQMLITALQVARSTVSATWHSPEVAHALFSGEKLTPPTGVKPPVVNPLSGEMQLIDPETGIPASEDNFNITFINSDAWFYGTVMPNFRGGDIRDVLFDKTALAAVPRFNSVFNAMAAMFGTDSDTGTLRKATRKSVGGHHLEDGAYVYTAPDGTKTTVHYDRRKLFREEADILSGRAMSDPEVALTRFFEQAVLVAAGDGGLVGRMATTGFLDLKDLPWNDAEAVISLISVSEAARRLSGGAKAAREDRPYAIHTLLGRAADVEYGFLPKEFVAAVEAAIRDAVAYAARDQSAVRRDGRADPAAKERSALKRLVELGFALERTRDVKDAEGNVTGTELYDVRLSIPVKLVSEIFKASTAHAKLLGAGREAADLDIMKNAEIVRSETLALNNTMKALGWTSDGDAKLFSDVGTAAPLLKGGGFYQHFSRRLDPPKPPEYKDAVAQQYASLVKALGSVFREERVTDEYGTTTETRAITMSEAARDPRFGRMFSFLRDLSGSGFTGDEDATAVLAVINQGRVEGLDASSNAWDIAKRVYSLSVRKLHDSAWNRGTVAALDMADAGLEAFNAAIETASESSGEDMGRVGATYSEVYNLTGAVPANLTASEAMARHAREVAEMMRYRATLTQTLMTADEYGMPLNYARPGSDANDTTVPDRVWGLLARWWAQSNSDAEGKGVYYDDSQSGRDNAIRLYDIIAKDKEAEGNETGVAGGLRRYLFSGKGILPEGMTTFSAWSAAKDAPGDDTKARLNVFGGGEAANIARQVFAIAGYGRPDARLAGINRVLSWSKSASVMCSLFFPIATAFESPAALIGTRSTLLGLTSTGAGFARWAKENHEWLSKALGTDDIATAPFMADILPMLGSDDPALTDAKTHAILCGLGLADRARNMTDSDRTVIAQDIKAATERVKATFGPGAAKAAKALLEGAMEHSSEFAFEYIINATKIAAFAQMNNRLRQKAIAAGRWWDPVRDMKKWATETNVEVGGTDPAMYPWMTPWMQQMLKILVFSWEWTLGAWEAGGGGVITQKWFGMTTTKAQRSFMFGRWVRMYGGIMIGLPVAMQLMITAMAKAFGDDGDDDKWFAWQNERGHGWKDFDITPLLRRISNSHIIPFVSATPTWGDVKKMEIPVISTLIPGLTGQEGEMVSSRKRRYYMHMGKQGWEVAGWFTNPTASFLSKMSMPAQKILEGVLGVNPSMGWDKEWKDTGFWERWTSLDPEKSALLNLTGAVLPFSFMGAARNPEIGALAAIGPAGKGISKTRAEKEMAQMFMEWGEAETFVAKHKGKPGAFTDLTSMSVEWLEGLRLNGYDPKTSLKNAIAAARKPLYERIHKAMPKYPGGKADTVELEAAARGLYRLDFVGKSLLKSIKAKDKNQNIKRVDALAKSTDEALRSAFDDPYGRRS